MAGVLHDLYKQYPSAAAPTTATIDKGSAGSNFLLNCFNDMSIMVVVVGLKYVQIVNFKPIIS
jgi:hypothetical protein